MSIDNQIQQIKALLSKAEAKLARYEAGAREAREEIAELGAALKVLGRLAPTPQDTAKPASARDANPTSPDRVADGQYRAGTLAEDIQYIMENDARTWWTSNELQDELLKLRGSEVPMTSVSPTLTRMKDKDLVQRDGAKVALLARVGMQEGGTPEGSVFD